MNFDLHVPIFFCTFAPKLLFYNYMTIKSIGEKLLEYLLQTILGVIGLAIIIACGVFIFILFPNLLGEYPWHVISAVFGVYILTRIIASYIRSEKLRKAEYRGIASKYGQYYRVVCTSQKFEEYKLIPVRIKGDKEKGIIRYNSMDPEYISSKRLLHMLSKEYEICKEGKIDSFTDE